jgi:hypothetical protein
MDGWLAACGLAGWLAGWMETSAGHLGEGITQRSQ